MTGNGRQRPHRRAALALGLATALGMLGCDGSSSSTPAAENPQAVEREPQGKPNDKRPKPPHHPHAPSRPDPHVDKALLAGTILPAGTDHRNAIRELAPYDDLVYDYPDLTEQDLIGRYFKPGDLHPQAVSREYSPRSGVTIKRDDWGVPFIYGDTDEDAWFGAGYVNAEDRLLIMELLRALGRGEVFKLLDTLEGWLADAEFIRLYGYSESELQAMAKRAVEIHGEEGKRLQAAMDNYVAGINAYLLGAVTNELGLPPVLADLGLEIRLWTTADIVAATNVVRALFGAGGGKELENARFFTELVEQFGAADGKQIYEDFRQRFNDDGPVHTEVAFPYGVFDPAQLDPAASVMAFSPGEPGLVGILQRNVSNLTGLLSRLGDSLGLSGGDNEADDGSGDAPGSLAGQLAALAEQARIRWEHLVLDTPLGRLPLNGSGGLSNALVVDGQRSSYGHPIQLGGPQTGYFFPQIMLELAIHSPNMAVRGGAFPGLGFAPVAGRAGSYAWTPTAGNGDMVDTRIVELCEPDGRAATEQSRHYRFDGECRPMQRRVVHRLEDLLRLQLPLELPLNELSDIVAERTHQGPVVARGRVGDKPVAVVRQRSTFMREADGAITLLRLASGEAYSAERFMEAFHSMNLSTNWMYVNASEIAYYHAGLYPRRHPAVHPDFPSWGDGRWEWQGFLDPTEHPHEINPERGFIVSWNNRIAPKWIMDDGKYAFGSLYRADLLEDGIKAVPKGEMDAVKLTQIMQRAGVTDLRGSHVLPLVLEFLDSGEPPSEQLAQVRELLADWVAAGALRRDGNRDGDYAHGGAIAVMDAWWEELIRAVFDPVLGDVARVPLAFDNAPGILGSAYQDGFYSHVQRDLAQLLGRPVKSRSSRIYCGGSPNNPHGHPTVCRQRLWESLERAVAKVSRDQGADPGGWSTSGEAERIRFLPNLVLSAHWNNRPTYQQLMMFGD